MPARSDLTGRVVSLRPGLVVDGLLITRALGFGIAVSLVGAGLAAVALFWGAHWLPAEALPYYGLGVGAACGAAMVAVWLHGRFLDPRAAAAYAGDGRLLAGRLQSLLAAAFGAKLFVLTVGVLGLRQAGVKFPELATFAITFAAVSLLCQLATAGFFSRVMKGRAPHPQTDSLAFGDRRGASAAGSTTEPGRTEPNS